VVRHFGCAGCHEISGLEDEGRIGTELTIEGSKPIERLDFALLTETASAVAANPSRPRQSSASPEGPAKPLVHKFFDTSVRRTSGLPGVLQASGDALDCLGR